MADVGAGEVLVRNVYLSLDPTNRVWMGEKDTYMPALKRGEVMRGQAIGIVENRTTPGSRQVIRCRDCWAGKSTW